MPKKFFISIVKSFIALVLFAIIFSGASADITKIVNNIFSGIYDYGSDEAQKQVISTLEENCGSLGRDGEAITMQQLCSNESLLGSMKENCKSYSSMMEYGIKVENEKNMMEACRQIESKDFEKACKALKGKRALAPDLVSLSDLCKRHKDGNISSRDFFIGFIGGSFSSKQTSSLGALENYNTTLIFLGENKEIYWIAIIALIAILYFLIKDSRNFAITLNGLVLGIGILILLPYIAILAYDKLYGIDTSQILSGLFLGVDSIGYKSLISIMLVAFLQMYSSFIIKTGIIMLGVGIAGKIFNFIARPKIDKKKVTSR